LKKNYLKKEIKIQGMDDAFKLHTSISILMDNLVWRFLLIPQSLQVYAGTLVIQPYTGTHQLSAGIIL
jgi:hypothetical protein